MHGLSLATGVQGLFVQEDADKALESPGQHENFGALKSWDHIHGLLDHDTKLLFLIRHGEAWSNRVRPQLSRHCLRDVSRVAASIRRTIVHANHLHFRCVIFAFVFAANCICICSKCVTASVISFGMA